MRARRSRLTFRSLIVASSNADIERAGLAARNSRTRATARRVVPSREARSMVDERASPFEEGIPLEAQKPPDGQLGTLSVALQGDCSNIGARLDYFRELHVAGIARRPGHGSGPRPATAHRLDQFDSVPVLRSSRRAAL